MKRLRRWILAWLWLLLGLGGAVQTFAQYNFTGVGWDNIDPTHPLGSESGASWAVALRQTRQAGVSGYGLIFQVGSGGLWITNVIPGYAYGLSSISMSNMGPDVLSYLSQVSTSGAPSTVVVTNALTYATSIEAQGPSYEVTTNPVSLASTLMVSNGFQRVMIEAQVYFNNRMGSYHNFTVSLVVNGQNAVSQGPYTVETMRTGGEPISTILNAGNPSNVTVQVLVQTDQPTANANLTASAYHLRVWWLP